MTYVVTFSSRFWVPVEAPDAIVAACRAVERMENDRQDVLVGSGAREALVTVKGAGNTTRVLVRGRMVPSYEGEEVER